MVTDIPPLSTQKMVALVIRYELRGVRTQMAITAVNICRLKVCLNCNQLAHTETKYVTELWSNK
jgi:hypothetical protein